MERQNYILKVDLNKEEAQSFSLLGPFIALSIKEQEANGLAKILGYEDGHQLIKEGFSSNPFTKNAFVALSYLYLSRTNTNAFDEFWRRLVFTDKEVEQKAREFFEVSSDKDTLSVEDLEAQWNLSTDLDELDG